MKTVGIPSEALRALAAEALDRNRELLERLASRDDATMSVGEASGIGREQCPKCRGTGKGHFAEYNSLYRERCVTCGGKGWHPTQPKEITPAPGYKVAPISVKEE